MDRHSSIDLVFSTRAYVCVVHIPVDVFMTLTLAEIKKHVGFSSSLHMAWHAPCQSEIMAYVKVRLVFELMLLSKICH